MSARHKTRGPVTVSLEPHLGPDRWLETLECSVTGFFREAPVTVTFDTGMPATLDAAGQDRVLDAVLSLAYPLVIAGRPLDTLAGELAALAVPYGEAMPPSELLSPDTVVAVEQAAITLGIDSTDAVLLVERLVLNGVLAAPLSPALSPEAEARLSLRRFESALPDPPPPEELDADPTD